MRALLEMTHAYTQAAATHTVELMPSSAFLIIMTPYSLNSSSCPEYSPSTASNVNLHAPKKEALYLIVSILVCHQSQSREYAIVITRAWGG